MRKRTFAGTYEEDMQWAMRIRARQMCSTREMAIRLFIPYYLWEDYETGARPVPDHIRRDAEHLLARGPLP